MQMLFCGKLPAINRIMYLSPSPSSLPFEEDFMRNPSFPSPFVIGHDRGISAGGTS